MLVPLCQLSRTPPFSRPNHDGAAELRRDQVPRSRLVVLLCWGLCTAGMHSTSTAESSTERGAEVRSIAGRVVDVLRGESWTVHHCDRQPSVRIDKYAGYRVTLRQTWREYTDVPQQKAEVQPAGPFKLRHADWQFVLFPDESGKAGLTAATRDRLMAHITWDESPSRYHNRSVFMGRGLGYLWFSRATLFDQEWVRSNFDLQGGDDRIPLLTDGLTIDDEGAMTSNSCQHALAKYGDEALPYIRAAIDRAGNEKCWRVIGSLAFIRTTHATEMLLELYDRPDKELHQAAVYALVHQPYRADAKRAYVDMIRNAERVDRVASACAAAVTFQWTEALPILETRISQPRSVRELRFTVAAQRALRAEPVPPGFDEAERAIWRLSGSDPAPDVVAASEKAKQFLVQSSDEQLANLVTLSLLDFTTKGQDEPVREYGRQILRERPRETTVQFLRDLLRRLPDAEQETVRRALEELTQ
ncbi:MAG: hypothetical protein KDA60_18110 [Planctomycetales bacterium]|nr:hypothetical protein [Planctomycetales bacterium]